MSGRAQSPALLLPYMTLPTPDTLMHINIGGGDAQRVLVERNSAFQVNSGRFPALNFNEVRHVLAQSLQPEG